MIGNKEDQEMFEHFSKQLQELVKKEGVTVRSMAMFNYALAYAMVGINALMCDDDMDAALGLISKVINQAATDRAKWIKEERP
jgi:hypothetical protein